MSRNFFWAVALISSIVASRVFSASSRSFRCAVRNSSRCFSVWYSSKAAKLMFPRDCSLSRRVWISSRNAAKSTNSSFRVALQLEGQLEFLERAGFQVFGLGLEIRDLQVEVVHVAQRVVVLPAPVLDPEFAFVDLRRGPSRRPPPPLRARVRRRRVPPAGHGARRRGTRSIPGRPAGRPRRRRYPRRA